MLRNLISSEQLTPDVIEQVFEAAKPMQALCDSGHRSQLLAHKLVALIFLEPSSRTMLSFQAAVQRLGGAPLMVHGKESSSVAKGESVVDTMKLVSGYADLVVARLPETGASIAASEACTVPFVNAGDGANEHPTQALIDVYTIQRELGTLSGLHVAFGFDPKHSRTIHSLARVLSRYPGNRFTFVAPRALGLPEKLACEIAGRGLEVIETDDLSAFGDADVLYLNRLQEERFDDYATYERYRHDYRLTPGMLTAKNRLILDPLPRVDEIAVEVDNLTIAAYFRQAHNGVPVRMALLAIMLGLA